MPRRILVVDDAAEKRELLKDFLTLQGFEVVLAENGKTGYRLSQESPPDLILMDLNMPDMQGVDVCRMIRQSQKTCDIPIMIVTGAQPSSRDKVWGFRSGADDYITAPFELEELMERIHAIFRRLGKETPAADGTASTVLPESEAARPVEVAVPLLAEPTAPAALSSWKDRLRERGVILVLMLKKFSAVLLDPIPTMESVQDEDYPLGLALLCLIVLLGSLPPLPAGSFGSWMAALILSLLATGLPWLALSGLAFMSLPFLGVEASWKRVSTVVALASAPKALGAGLSFLYGTATGLFHLAMTPHAFSSGADLLWGKEPHGFWRLLARIGVFDGWSAALTAAGLIVVCRIQKGMRLPFAVLIGGLGLLFGTFTSY